MRAMRSAALSLAALVLCTVVAQAQLNDILNGGLLNQAGGASGAAGPEAVVTVAAQIAPPRDGRPAMVIVSARIEPPYYTYSTTQKPVAAMPTRITVAPSSDYRLAGEFRSTLPPKIVREGEIVLEEHSGEVVWQAPLDVRPGVDLGKIMVKGQIAMQVCQVGTCFPPTDFPFEATLAEPAAPPVASGEYKHPRTHATIRGALEQRVATPGSTVNLVITAEPAAGYHVYELTPSDPGDLGYKPTLIALTNTSEFRVEPTKASAQALQKPGATPDFPPQRYYEKPVSWTIPIVIPKGTRAGVYPIEGLIGYQTCNETGCDPPVGSKFSGTITVGPAAAKGTVPLAFGESYYNDAAKFAASHPGIEDVAATAGGVMIGWSLPIVILAGLAGGFILNFMPCVLPVIGLKLLSFADQAGKSRSHILALNLWYSLGTMSVLWVLATLATAVHWGFADQNLGWGEQFGSTYFNIVMVAIVWVMSLSFLGVWEIPIPGFVGSGKASEIATREGAAGAFFKGILATVLATPCSGPALGPVFGYTLNQPWQITYLLFTCIGLGMSAPYLLIGAFPRLIRFLPKPGAWMDTFKQIMGFVMLGTIVFLFSFMDRDYLVATFAMMVGLWAACWWIGRTSLTEALPRKLVAWGQGAALAALVGYLSFTWLTPHSKVIEWQPLSIAELDRLKTSGKTVMVDFTADWCFTCQQNSYWVIETPEIREALAKYNVVPMLADYTKTPPDIKNLMASLQSTSIPLLAIYPAGRPDRPIVLRDVITKPQLLSALKEAAENAAGSKLTAAH